MQSAYRHNHSTETALLRVHNDISLALDSNKINDVILVLLDLSSACDMVNRQILLKTPGPFWYLWYSSRLAEILLE